MFLKNKSEQKTSFLRTEIDHSSLPSFQNPSSSIKNSQENLEHDEYGDISIFSKSSSQQPNGSIVIHQQETFQTKHFSTPQSRIVSNLENNLMENPIMKIDIIECSSLEQNTNQQGFCSPLKISSIKNRRILNMQNKNIEDCRSDVVQKYNMDSDKQDSSFEDKQPQPVQTSTCPPNLTYSQIVMKQSIDQKLEKVDGDLQQNPPENNNSFQIKVHQPSAIPQKLKHEFTDKFSAERELQKEQDFADHSALSKLGYQGIYDEKQVRHFRYDAMMSKYRNIENLADEFNQEVKILRNAKEEGKLVKIIRKVKNLEKQCREWSQRLKQIEYTYWLQMGEKDQMLGQIQHHLSTIDNLKYDNFLQREQTETLYLRKLESKISQIQKYHQLLSLDRESQIQELTSKISDLEHENRMTKIVEPQNHNDSESDNELIGMQSRVLNMNFLVRQEEEPLRQDENQSLMTQLYSQLNEALQKCNVQQLQADTLQEKLNYKDLQLKQLTTKLTIMEQKKGNLQQRNASLSEKVQTLEQQMRNITGIKDLHEKNWSNVTTQLSLLNEKYKEKMDLLQENEAKVQKIKGKAEQQLNNIQNQLRKKSTLLEQLKEQQQIMEQQFKEQTTFVDNVWGKLKPLYQDAFNISDLKTSQNRNRFLQNLYRIPQTLLAQSFYIDIQYKLQIRPIQISVNGHKRLLNECLIMRNNCNQLLLHLKRMQQQNKMLLKNIQQANATKERQLNLIENLNELILKQRVKFTEKRVRNEKRKCHQISQ